MLKLNSPTLGIALEQRRMIIEEIVQRELMNYEHNSMFTIGDELMIKRLNKEQKLSGQEIVDEVLKFHKR